MRLNKKGVSIVEIIVAIVLVSIVLTFLMNLFVKIRGTYNNSKIQTDYEILESTVIRALGDDIEKYGLESIEYEDYNNKDTVIITFKEHRATKLSEKIKKILKVYESGDTYHISYIYDDEYTSDITSVERITNIVREVPKDAILNENQLIEISYMHNRKDENNIAKIKILMGDKNGNNYDINVYGEIILKS